MEILDDIQKRIEVDKSTPEELFIKIRNTGLQMFMSKSLSREQVIVMCSSLIKMYNDLHEVNQNG